ncbi:hypothetical protein DL96DRAFT_1714111 [Flagelloscypha sp. PMI_526]|nr:hypothetical protein DL96DRAFT_1714111 [Flagelloscypha sp. PMI_526]
MSSKQLSNGTLSLKFMQNAQRANDLPIADLERAQVIQDGQWEIPRNIQDSWNTSQPSSTTNAIHEPSYIPFLFSSEQTSSSITPAAFQSSVKGRRSYAKGREVEPEAKTSLPSPAQQKPEYSPSSSVREGKKPVRLKSLSDVARAPSQGLKRSQSKASKDVLHQNPVSNGGMSARALIHQNPITSSVPGTFLKPVGVDAIRTSERTRSSVDPVAFASSSKKRSPESNDLEPPKKRKKSKKGKAEVTTTDE